MPYDGVCNSGHTTQPLCSLTTQTIAALTLICAFHIGIQDQRLNPGEIFFSVCIIAQLPAGGPGHPVRLSTEGGVQILMPQTPTKTQEKRRRAKNKNMSWSLLPKYFMFCKFCHCF